VDGVVVVFPRLIKGLSRQSRVLMVHLLKCFNPCIVAVIIIMIVGLIFENFQLERINLLIQIFQLGVQFSILRLNGQSLIVQILQLLPFLGTVLLQLGEP
jgi:hypothetical protein